MYGNGEEAGPDDIVHAPFRKVADTFVHHLPDPQEVVLHPLLRGNRSTSVFCRFQEGRRSVRRPHDLRAQDYGQDKRLILADPPLETDANDLYTEGGVDPCFSQFPEDPASIIGLPLRKVLEGNGDSQPFFGFLLHQQGEPFLYLQGRDPPPGSLVGIRHRFVRGGDPGSLDSLDHGVHDSHAEHHRNHHRDEGDISFPAASVISPRTGGDRSDTFRESPAGALQRADDPAVPHPDHVDFRDIMCRDNRESVKCFRY